jgi:hypothetical protein
MESNQSFILKGIAYENPLDNREETIALSRIYKDKKDELKEITLVRYLQENNTYVCWRDYLTMNKKKQCFLNDEKLRGEDTQNALNLFKELGMLS